MAVVSSAESYSKLKKDLLFHEKRMQLLLSTRIVDDMENNLLEKTLSRKECSQDCSKAMASFEAAAAEARLSGRWDDLKIANLLGLEVPLDVIVGSQKFDPPQPADQDALKEMITRLRMVSKRFPELSCKAIEDVQSVDELLANLDKVQWTCRDVQRIRDAIGAKLNVLSELDNLAATLQDSSYSVACEETELEALRRIGEKAIEDGEMAVSDSNLRERMKVIEKIIDILFFECHTIEASVDSNVTKRKSNVTVFQGAAATLACIKSEKRNIADGALRDISRIERGIAYEDKAKGTTRSKAHKAMQESLDRIRQLDTRQEELSQRLRALFRDFSETELALEQTGQERQKAVAAHIELVESGRHATADFMELSHFAEAYSNNLRKTREEHEHGMEAVEKLEKALLQEHTFDSYDFSVTAKRLSTMQRRVCIDLNRALNEYESHANELLRRLTSIQKKTDDEIDRNTAEVEVRREVFDPSTKKYITEIRKLTEERASIVKDCNDLRDVVERQREACLAKIQQHLAPEEIVDVSATQEVKLLQRREELSDMRQTLVTPPEITVIEERIRLLREQQQQQQLVAQQGNDSGLERSSTKSVASKKASRVLSVREEVQRTKALIDAKPVAANVSTPNVSVVEPSMASHDVSESVVGPHSDEYRKKARVIGRQTPPTEESVPNVQPSPAPL